MGPTFASGRSEAPERSSTRSSRVGCSAPGWTSRTIQAVLHALLTDPTAVAEVDAARLTYASRRVALTSALLAEGVALPPGDGINLWLPVADERAALVHLAAGGIRVAPGVPFQLGESRPHVRVTVGVVPVESAPAVASALARAAEAAG